MSTTLLTVCIHFHEEPKTAATSNPTRSQVKHRAPLWIHLVGTSKCCCRPANSHLLRWDQTPKDTNAHNVWLMFLSQEATHGDMLYIPSTNTDALGPSIQCGSGVSGGSAWGASLYWWVVLLAAWFLHFVAWVFVAEWVHCESLWKKPIRLINVIAWNTDSPMLRIV